jgi:hypothetical protein
MILIAILFPWLPFLMKGKLLPTVACLILQATVVGWLPAAIWAVNAIQLSRLQERNEDLISEVLGSSSINIYS